MQADADVRAMLVTHEGAVVFTAEQPPSPTAIYEGVEVAVEVAAEPAPEHPTATSEWANASKAHRQTHSDG